MDLLLQHGADVNRRDAQGRTLLMIAAHASAFETVKLLLERGARLDAIDKQRKTVLYWAQRDHVARRIAYDARIEELLHRRRDELVLYQPTAAGQDA